jgi:hypothetical protein
MKSNCSDIERNLQWKKKLKLKKNLRKKPRNNKKMKR